MDENSIARLIVDAAFAVHTNLGPGLLESVCEAALAIELEKRGLRFRRQVVVPAFYDGVSLGDGFRADLIVEKKVIVEVKSLERGSPVHGKQVLTYLRLTGLRLGLLINFGAAYIRDGVKRVANRMPT